MSYRFEAQSPAAVVQLIAASYLRHGFYWYVTGSIPDGKDPAVIDRKLIAKYGIEVSNGNAAIARNAALRMHTTCDTSVGSSCW